MQPDNLIELKVVALTAEMDGIHFVNSLYRHHGAAVTCEARADYKRREQRLEGDN